MILFIHLKAGSLFKFLQIILYSSIKFILALPLAIFKFDFNFLQTIMATTIGGIIGVIFFFYLSDWILRAYKKTWPKIKNYFSSPVPDCPKIHQKVSVKTNKKKFTKRNKFIILTRRKYGLWGIVALTPVFLSIPLGSFLANKYYRNTKGVIVSLSLSILCWSIILSSLYFLL